ncbi:MAG: glycosyltransferase [Bacteroidetes bacterium]|nr:MAG: glycosyltransferase [Bacteroidota bacterium]
MQKNKPKILHVSPSYFPAHRFGGPIQSVYQLNNELSEHVDIEIITTNAGLLTDSKIIPNQKTFLKNIPIIYFSFFGYEHYNFSIKLLVFLFKNIKKYDLVHITAVWNFPVFATALACWIFKKPYIISPRGTIYAETMALGSSVFKKIYYQLIAKWCLKNAAKIHYTSEDEKSKVEHFLDLKNGFVLANGLDFQHFNDVEKLSFPDFIPQKEYILFLGRIDPKKGLDILLIAFQKLLMQFPNLNLIIAGPDSNNYKSKLEQEINRLQINENVIFVGEVLGKQKLSLYKFAKIFVLTSYSENFGMTVVEAIACKCPILISDKVGIWNELTDANAGEIVETNSESILHGLINTLNLPKQEIEIRIKNALDLAHQKYNIKNIALSFSDIYKEIISNDKT